MPRCVKCGKETNKLIEGLCLDCYIKQNPPQIKVSRILVCGVCGRVRVGKSWTKTSFERFVKVKPPYKLVEVNEDSLVLELEGELFQFPFQLPIEKGICPTCAKVYGEYYETLLQVRGKNASKEVWKIIEEKKPTISKFEEKKNGYDIYFVNYREAEAIVRELQKKVRGSVSKSYQLYSRDRQTSRDKYRATIIFRETKLGTGDLVEYAGERWKVVKVKNKEVILKKGNRVITVPRWKLENF